MPTTTVVTIPIAGRRSINAYLVLGERPIIVDAGTPGSAGKIRDAIARRGVDPADVALVVLTTAWTRASCRPQGTPRGRCRS